MKKVWLLIYVFTLSIINAKATDYDAFPSDHWVDSIYQNLTVAERVGQLIDLKITPEAGNIAELEELISKYKIGALTIAGGDAVATAQLVRNLKKKQNVPLFITSENNQSLALPFYQQMSVPEPETIDLCGEVSLFQKMFAELHEIYRDFGVSSHTFNPVQASFSGTGFNISNPTDHKLLAGISGLYKEYNMPVATDLYFDFRDDFAFSPKAMDNWNNSEWREIISSEMSDWKNLNDNTSIIQIKSLPYFPESEAQDFYKKVINPLFWKQLQFSGLISVDYSLLAHDPLHARDRDPAKKLLKLGVDKIVVEGNPENFHSEIMEAMEGREFRRNEIREKVKRNLRLKYECGLVSDTRTIVYNDHAVRRLQEPQLRNYSYQIYERASKASMDSRSVLPIVDVEQYAFASLSLGYSESKVFQETLEKYAPFVHYMLPDASFNPYDLENISRQLRQFDFVIIGLHTNDLVSLDQNTIDFLNDLNSVNNVVLAYLGKEINIQELNDLHSKIVMHEDNTFTQQIAAYRIFGAEQKELSRLAYGLPESAGMDSRTLSRIDDIVKEAITAGATPGCQLLVARNGSVVMERGYGYYTYDSIMPVDTRTIYDLASITKVAATTQALMKLYEQDQIQLDSAVGKYLPELIGTNKEDLKIRDVLSHQSGLRAFYPFWRYTIDDNEQLLHYYKRYPDQDYSNTVAMGMFAANDLKDSLWHWTIDTRLRRKRYSFEPYDYKYSDLGFYLLQTLFERVSATSLDTYVDSVFYKPMGTGTMSFNPLCKHQHRRIAPTEYDRDFRHVLVWGTVHDQIAAMKGGVSGHAGLFSNAHDVAKLMQMQLQHGKYGGKQFLDEKTIAEFTAYQSADSRRGLGWDKPEKREDEYNPASRYASHESFGHSGFTGTIAWADPAFDLVFVFLSNRIYPEIANPKLNDLHIRKRIQDVVYESIWNFEKYYY